MNWQLIRSKGELLNLNPREMKLQCFEIKGREASPLLKAITRWGKRDPLFSSYNYYVLQGRAVFGKLIRADIFQSGKGTIEQYCVLARGR